MVIVLKLESDELLQPAYIDVELTITTYSISAAIVAAKLLQVAEYMQLYCELIIKLVNADAPPHGIVFFF
jgi:hypothetical protein